MVRTEYSAYFPEQDVWLYSPFPSRNKNKKYSVYVISEVDGDERVRLIHFGQKGMEHYQDKLGHYSNMDHLDEDRRRSFRKRFALQDHDDINKPMFWSWHYLW